MLARLDKLLMQVGYAIHVQLTKSHKTEDANADLALLELVSFAKFVANRIRLLFREYVLPA